MGGLLSVADRLFIAELERCQITYNRLIKTETRLDSQTTYLGNKIMFTVDQNDLLKVVNSPNIEATVKKVVDSKVSQATILGFGALVTAFIVATLLSVAFRVTIDPIMFGYSALPLMAGVALRVWYISTLYSEALLMQAIKKSRA